MLGLPVVMALGKQVDGGTPAIIIRLTREGGFV